MGFQKFDFFSSPFLFNVGSEQSKKGTVSGKEQKQIDDQRQSQFQQNNQQLFLEQQSEPQKQIEVQASLNEQEEEFMDEIVEQQKVQEIDQQKSIPLFQYLPSFSFQKNKQPQKNIDIEILEQEQKLSNSNNLNQNYLAQESQSVKLSILEDSFKTKNDSFASKHNISDKQILSMISESCFSIQNQLQKSKSLQKDNYSKKYSVFNLKEIKQDKGIYQQQKESVINQTTKEKEEDSEYLKKLKAIQDTDSSAKIQKHIFGTKLCKKRLKFEQIELISKNQQHKINKQINQDLDILNFYSDIIFIKKAVMLLLRKDQLASLKLIGLSPNILELDLKSIDVNAIKTKLSYYEKQYAILQSEKLQEYHFEKFLKRCNNNQELNEIDRRILYSLKLNQIV
ncbi:hypothetical protein ABPG73_023089 [Tetrahymena malaccensis]